MKLDTSIEYLKGVGPRRAEGFKKELLTGTSFESLEKEHSQDPGSKNNGGSLGWVKRGSLVKNFDTAGFPSKINDVVGPIENDFGFHLIETLDKNGEKILHARLQNDILSGFANISDWRYVHPA